MFNSEVRLSILKDPKRNHMHIPWNKTPKILKMNLQQQKTPTQTQVWRVTDLNPFHTAIREASQKTKHTSQEELQNKCQCDCHFVETICVPNLMSIEIQMSSDSLSCKKICSY